MTDLAWAASTPEGARLGQMAVQTLRLELTPLPLWFAPIEPIRWLLALTTLPHAFYTGLLYLAVSVLLAYIIIRRRKTVTGGAAVGLSTMLTLSGLFLGSMWLLTTVDAGARWVVPPDAPYVLANLHSHTQASGGQLMPEDVVAWHARKGYRVVAITDSNTVRGGVRAREMAERNRWPVTVLVGEEYRGATHLIMLNLARDISAADTPLPEAIEQARRDGGFVIAAHAWTGVFSTEELVAMGVQGFEVTDGSRVASPSIFGACQARRLAETGDIDFRAGNFPLTATVLPPWAQTPHDVQKALEQGASAAVYLPDVVTASAIPSLGQFLRGLERMRQQGRLGSGLLVWLVAAFVLGLRRRFGRKPPRARPACSAPSMRRKRAVCVVVGLFTVTAVLGAWAMWWQFRSGWVPRTEWVLICWCVTCPACWFATRRVLSVSTPN